MTYYKLRLYVGTELTKRGLPIPAWTVAEWLEETENLLLEQYGGFSRSEVFGAYKATDGTVARERALVFEIIVPSEDFSAARAQRIADTIRDIWQQESVLRTFEPVEGGF